MKRKNSDRPVRHWLPRIGISFVLLLLLVPTTLFSFVLGMLHQEDASPTRLDALVGQFTNFVHTPSYTILQEIQRAEPAGSLYLSGWIMPDATACLGVIWIGQSRGVLSGYDFHGSVAECDLDQFSIDQFWTGYGWDPVPFSAAYGYSGDAARAVVTWQDGTIKRLAPIDGTYLAIHEERLQVIEAVDFYDAEDSLIYRFPDDKRAEMASGRSGS